MYVFPVIQVSQEHFAFAALIFTIFIASHLGPVVIHDASLVLLSFSVNKLFGLHQIRNSLLLEMNITVTLSTLRTLPNSLNHSIDVEITTITMSYH